MNPEPKLEEKIARVREVKEALDPSLSCTKCLDEKAGVRRVIIESGVLDEALINASVRLARCPEHR